MVIFRRISFDYTGDVGLFFKWYSRHRNNIWDRVGIGTARKSNISHMAKSKKDRRKMNYESFLKSKTLRHRACGLDIPVDDLNPMLFEWQKVLVRWALYKGRAALFEECGTGKSAQQLEWAQHIIRRTNKNVLVLTPLAVAQQTIKEGDKFGIECKRSHNGEIPHKITVTNYERLHYFSPNDFIGVVCDESSILKNFDGKRRKQINEFLKRVKYCLLCTATAAPNDYTELGTSSEAIGAMGYMDMLGRFFKNNLNNCSTKRSWAMTGGSPPKWRFKKHAEADFWRWVCSWSRSIRKPSDMGYDDDGFILPELIENEIILKVTKPLPGKLFPEPAMNLHEQRQERRQTLKARCEYVAQKVDHNRPVVVWCHLNDEGDFLEKIIPDAKQVKGGMKDDLKEAILEDFTNGNIRVLVIKPRIGAFGLNWQHCNHATFFPSHSYEQYYQGVRRLWRFGQKRPVTIDIIASEGERTVLLNLKRKAREASIMFDKLVKYMNDAMQIDIKSGMDTKGVLPKWM